MIKSIEGINTNSLSKLPAITPVDFWWNDSSIDIVKVDGSLYALNGWNGEEYTDCWECLDKFTANPDGHRYCIRPVHRYEVEGINLAELVERDLENTPEWDEALEVVQYSVT